MRGGRILRYGVESMLDNLFVIVAVLRFGFPYFFTVIST
jgi:hypothetical protein